jgi:hypothetical protein
MWFEKFAWFITSDNYLVVAGKDAQQNEQLVKRYLRPGDAYLHAEVHGAATCILRAKRRRMADGKTQVIPLSERALSEAGTFTISRSSAWSSKMVTSAYWVESHQVSKTAPTGEYLTVGSFMIRGRKNFLPASTLEMGLGVLFRLGDEASIARHANERRDFALMEHEEVMKAQEKNAVPKESVSESKTEAAEDPLPTVDEQDDSEDAKEGDLADEASGKGVVDEPGLEDEKDESASDDNTPPEQGSTSENKSREQSSGSQQQPNANIKKKQKEMSRGKRAKAKRAKQKYQDQDDADRELAMMALQGGESSKKGKKGKGSKITPNVTESQQKAASETMSLLVRDSKKVSETLDPSVRNILAECVTVKVTKGSEGVRWNKFDAEVLEQLRDNMTLEEQLASVRRLLDLSKSSRIDNFSASLSGIIRTVKRHGTNFKDGDGGAQDGKQRKTKAEKQAEKEAWQEILAEDGIIDNEEGDDGGPVDDSAELAKLTGKPSPDDVILFAVPVCAPYQVLSQYKYRVKLTPGSVKRGKASKQCLEMFLYSDIDKKAVDDSVKRDRELIRLVNENEWVQSIIGDVRITSAGASKVVKKQKNNAKSKKK